MLQTFINGFLIELSLIISVGLQNAFILRQGIRSENVIVAIVVCTICESLLVTIGIAGVGAIISTHTWLIKVITILGVVFLTFYALRSVYMAIYSNEALIVDTEMVGKRTALAVALSALSFGLLNPHVLIDTTLMGGLSVRYFPYQWYFCLGAITAATLWYSFLGLLGKIIAKPLNKPRTWKIINLLIALLCGYMAFVFTSSINNPDAMWHGHFIEIHDHEHNNEHSNEHDHEHNNEHNHDHDHDNTHEHGDDNHSEQLQ